MDTLKKEQHEAHERLKVLYKEKDHLAVSYKEKKKKVDDLKEQLQTKIGEYSKLSESGTNALILTENFGGCKTTMYYEIQRCVMQLANPIF